MIVAQDGSGDYTSLNAAIASIPADHPDPITIFIKQGTYVEKVFIDVPYITLIGESPESTLITYNDYALKPLTDDLSFGTFNSYTLFIGAHDFTACNLTIQNTAGPGHQVGQAIAAYVDADRVYFKNCHFIGCQDTLFTGPLPPSPIMPGSFRGPRENSPRNNGRQYYENCFIKGDIDFIFGSATAYFYQCEIFSNNINQEINGYISAASTPVNQKYGYVFSECRLTSDCPKQSVYLGRPWRIYAQTVFLNCELGDHIHPMGWHDWDKIESHTAGKFAEYHNFGPGNCPASRSAWSMQLSDTEASDYTREKVLSGDDAWQPWL